MRAKPAEMAALREEVFARAHHRCEWPGCSDPAQVMAHLTHRGMGGSAERNVPGNCAAMCERHHDVLDGRTGLGTLRWELNEMMRAVISRSPARLAPQPSDEDIDRDYDQIVGREE